MPMAILNTITKTIFKIDIFSTKFHDAFRVFLFQQTLNQNQLPGLIYNPTNIYLFKVNNRNPRKSVTLEKGVKYVQN